MRDGASFPSFTQFRPVAAEIDSMEHNSPKETKFEPSVNIASAGLPAG